jgi:hypothetical protein
MTIQHRREEIKEKEEKNPTKQERGATETQINEK